MVVLTLAAVLGTVGAAAQTPRQARPNVIVIETDDQTLDEMAVLARTRRLIGGAGVTFDNSFVSFSLCCPSRATLLTGQYAHNHGVRSNKLPEGGYYKLDSRSTLPVWLQQSGYYTALIGKYLNGYGNRRPREVPPGWSEWHGAIDAAAYRYFGYRLYENGGVKMYCATLQPACYQTDVYRDKTTEMIRRRAPRKQPFFIWVAFAAPHAGGPRDPDDPPRLETPVPAPRHRDAFAEQSLPTPPSFNEADVSDKPASIRRRRLLSASEIASIQENWQQRRETLLAVDEAVESIVATLGAVGELDDTLIVFTSDNGFFHGEHRVPNGKVLPYEPSIRVPLLIRGPGIPRGVHRSQLVSNIDLAPTILDATNVRPGRAQDGISLRPLARDPTKEMGRDLLVESVPGTGQFDAVRTLNYVYAEYATGERELYDLTRDPYELQSLHDDPPRAALRDALASRLHGLVACAGPGCRTSPTVLVRASCSGGTLRASATGSGVLSVDFYVDGRRVGTDSAPPFAVRVPAPRVPARGIVRARATIEFDRLVSRDVPVGGC